MFTILSVAVSGVVETTDRDCMGVSNQIVEARNDYSLVVLQPL